MPAIYVERGYRFWTPERDVLLALHWPDKSASQIARIIGHGCTRHAVIGRANRMRAQLGLESNPARKPIWYRRRRSKGPEPSKPRDIVSSAIRRMEARA